MTSTPKPISTGVGAAFAPGWSSPPACAEIGAPTHHRARVAGTPRLEQQRAVAEAAVVDYLRATGAHSEYPGLTWQVGFDPARDSVVVSIRAPLDLPLTVPGSPERASISARAAAVVQLDPGVP